MYVCRPIATWIVGSNTCGLWQGVCTTPLCAGLVVIFSDKHSESTICTNTIQTGMIYCFGLANYVDLSECPAVFLSLCRTTSQRGIG